MSSAGHGTWDQLLTVTQARLGANATGERRKISLERLAPNPDQPRKFFDAAALDELATSMGRHGVLQPLLVRPHPQDPRGYQIVAGERRWLAARQAGLKEVPVEIRAMDDHEALELGLVENLLREDISPMEEARALQRLLTSFGYSFAELGERLGKNKSYVDHRVRLLKMPPEVQEALERLEITGDDGKPRRPFSPRHAGVVVQLTDETERRALIDAILVEGLSVAEATRRQRLVTPPRPMPSPASPDAPPIAPDHSIASRRRERPRDTHAVDVLANGARVDVLSLALYPLLENARRGDGRVSVVALARALDADRETLRGLLAASPGERTERSEP